MTFSISGELLTSAAGIELPDFILRASKRTTSSLVFSGAIPKAKRGAFVVGESQADQTKSRWIILDLIEQQHGPLIELRRRFDQGADLIVPVRAFDQAPWR